MDDRDFMQTWKDECTFKLPSLLLFLGSLQPVSGEQTQAILLAKEKHVTSTLAASQAAAGYLRDAVH